MIIYSNIYLIISLFFVASTIIFAFFLFLQKNKTKQAWAMIRLVLATIFWLLLDVSTSFVSVYDSFSLIVWRLGFVAAFLLSLSSLFFVFVFINGKVPRYYYQITVFFLFYFLWLPFLQIG